MNDMTRFGSGAPAPQARRAAPAAARPDTPFEALDACHREVLRALDAMADLIRHVDDRGVDEHARRVAHDIHLFFSTTAVNHHLDEERHVFPRLLASADAELVQVTQRLQQDHGWLDEDWMELAPQLDSMARGYTWHDLDVLRHGLDVFRALYLDHVRLEESLIYPEARLRLSDLDLLTMSREMAERRSTARKAAPTDAPSPSAERLHANGAAASATRARGRRRLRHHCPVPQPAGSGPTPMPRR